MTPEYDKEFKRFVEQAKPVLEWLENKGRIEINGHKTGFNMNYYYMEGMTDFKGRECDMVFCIAGALRILNNLDTFDINNFSVYSVINYPRDIFPIMQNDILKLINPNKSFEGDRSILYAYVKPKQAHKVLKHFIETGIVDWNDVYEYQKKKGYV